MDSNECDDWSNPDRSDIDDSLNWLLGNRERADRGSVPVVLRWGNRSQQRSYLRSVSFRTNAAQKNVSTWRDSQARHSLHCSVGFNL